jgi:hypothetical protein
MSNSENELKALEAEGKEIARKIAEALARQESADPATYLRKRTSNRLTKPDSRR